MSLVWILCLTRIKRPFGCQDWHLSMPWALFKWDHSPFPTSNLFPDYCWRFNYWSFDKGRRTPEGRLHFAHWSHALLRKEQLHFIDQRILSGLWLLILSALLPLWYSSEFKISITEYQLSSRLVKWYLRYKAKLRIMWSWRRTVLASIS